MNKVNHTVFCITYNQSHYIEKCIRSLFSCEVYPSKVYVLDDCSTDCTLAIVRAIQHEYPGIIEILENEKNLGVYGNLNRVRGLPVGDLNHLLAGDDWYEPGMFSEMNEVLAAMKDEEKRKKFIIMAESYSYSDGLLKRHKIRNKKETLFKKILRQNIFYIPVGMSREYFKTFPVYRTDLGIWGDFIHTLNFAQNCEKLYYLKNGYPVYRMGVGISSKTNEKAQNESFLRVLKIIKMEINDKMERSDMRFLEFLILLYRKLNREKLSSFSLYTSFILNLSNGARLLHLKKIIKYQLRKIRQTLRI